eukprot:8897028-Heterocapsa_arctica.AAC.1
MKNWTSCTNSYMRDYCNIKCRKAHNPQDINLYRTRRCKISSISLEQKTEIKTRYVFKRNTRLRMTQLTPR